MVEKKGMAAQRLGRKVVEPEALVQQGPEFIGNRKAEAVRNPDAEFVGGRMTEADSNPDVEAVGDKGEFAPDTKSPPIVAKPGRPRWPRRPRRPGRQEPALRLVQAGDLITADFMNDLVQAVQDLQSRVADLEAADDDDSSDDFSANAI
ncbi:MAG TPA: hypothetical protein VGA98_00445 [Allosphingosinicella sp.]